MNEDQIRSALTIAQAKDIALQQGLAGTDREIMNILEQRCFRLEGKLDAARKALRQIAWNDPPLPKLGTFEAALIAERAYKATEPPK